MGGLGAAVTDTMGYSEGWLPPSGRYLSPLLQIGQKVRLTPRAKVLEAVVTGFLGGISLMGLICWPFLQPPKGIHRHEHSIYLTPYFNQFYTILLVH